MQKCLSFTAQCEFIYSSGPAELSSGLAPFPASFSMVTGTQLLYVQCLFNQMIGCRAKLGTTLFVLHYYHDFSFMLFCLFLIESFCVIYIFP